MNKELRAELKKAGIGARAFNEAIATANAALKKSTSDEGRVAILRLLYVGAYTKGVRTTAREMGAFRTRGSK